ncbi:transglycosylase SLT domain-containing protein [Sulfuriflexus sp.]|uniref:transglycosylase SLT domain-containing protein n=1 Tax=Sulfuriflexus sp. TaxID=2015443 RepID=UPI0028CC6006|nr:transglycosylase SLT domain-containing protein [Sulfuriflexus sp.]MDT8404174.1 transglycosylase SLT domain-containing protein [Sulfuriflexus sp.]
MIIRTCLGFLLCLCLLPLPAYAGLDQQRTDFLEARKAVRQGDTARYKKLLTGLQDYPLKPYLEYEALQRGLDQQPSGRIHAFLEANQDSPLQKRLRRQWLTSLARQGRWQEFVADYRDLNNTRLACQYAHGLQKLGRHKQAKIAAEALWLTGKSQPRACDPVFKSWRASGNASPELIWERVRLAMHKRRPSLARYLAKFLGPEDRTWVERWYRMYRQPAKMLDHPAFKKDNSLVREILLHGLERLARLDAAEATKRWHEIRDHYSFSREDIGKLERRIGLSAATQGLSDAHALLDRVDISWTDNTVHEWRVRSALRAGNWQAALQGIEAMPAELAQQQSWRYWRARALEKTGFRKQANELYASLAARHDYHSLLAADRLGMAYSLEGTSLTSSEAELEKIRNIPGIRRAGELYHVGLEIDARREWHHTIASFDKRQLQVAAILANRWNWHDRVVFTLGRTDTLDDLKLRFPIVYEKQVRRHAQRNQIDTAWVFGILRQESAYMSDARSHAGALGLMQLMPRTARYEARKLKLPLANQYDILDVDKNIRLGTAHLKRVLDINNGNQVLATASYNAGAQRVKSWLPESGQMDADVWIETMPFHETRKYVKRVMSTMAIFEKHLGEPVSPLEQRLTDIRRTP